MKNSLRKLRQKTERHAIQTFLFLMNTNLNRPPENEKEALFALETLPKFFCDVSKVFSIPLLSLLKGGYDGELPSPSEGQRVCVPDERKHRVHRGFIGRDSRFKEFQRIRKSGRTSESVPEKTTEYVQVS